MFDARYLLFALAHIVMACGAEPPTFPAPGDASYKHAELCTSSELAPFVQDASDRWGAATPSVQLSVRTMDVSQTETEGCAVTISIDPKLCASVGDEGLARPGHIYVDGSGQFMSDASDVIAHEIGHLLIGGTDAQSHSDDPASVMFWADQPGEQAIMPADVEKIGAFAR